MYAFLAGVMVARFWRGLLWAAGWVVAVGLSAAHTGWGIVPLMAMGLLALVVRRRRQIRWARQLEWERQARLAEMQLQAELNAQAQHEWAQQQRFAEMQLQAQLNARALFDEHARRTPGLPTQRNKAAW